MRFGTKRSAARFRPPVIWRAVAPASFGVFIAVVGSALAVELPKTEDDLIAVVRNAILSRDMALFMNLVNWDQARPLRQRAVKAQISTTFGRPIRSITLEPLPAEGLREVESRGTLRANMPLSHKLRVVFDEPDGDAGILPADVFLIGRDSQGYRIGLIVPVQRRSD